MPAPFATAYEPSSSTQIPDATAVTQVSPDSVTVTYTLGKGDPKSAGAGTLTSTVSAPPGVTITPYDSATGKFVVIGPVAGVNSVLAGVQYNSAADEKNEIPYDLLIEDSEGNTAPFCEDALQLVPTDALYPSTEACTGTLTLTGSSGTISISLVDEEASLKEVLTSAPIPFDTDLTTTATNLVNDINTNATMATATDLGSGTFQICAVKSLGKEANCWDVIAVVTGTMGMTGTTKLSGGVTGKINPKIAEKQLGDKLFDLGVGLLPLLGTVATSLFSADNSALSISIRRDESNPVRELLFYLQSFPIPVPDPYDEETRIMSGTFATWKTSGFPFKTVNTDNPAWWFLYLVRDTNIGLGNQIPLQSTELEVLYEDCFNASARNDTTVDSGDGVETRNLANWIFNNTTTNIGVLEEMASIMQARPIFDESLRLIQDRPGNIKAIFNETNVINDGGNRGFTYIGGSMKAEFNSVEITWFPPELPDESKTEIVTDTSLIVAANQTKRILGVGIAQVGQAIRQALSTLYNEALSNPLTVSWTTGYEGENVTIGDVVQINDFWDPTIPDLQKNAGRILDEISLSEFRISHRTAITIGDPIAITRQDGTLHITTVDSFNDEGVTIRPEGSATITIDTAMPESPFPLATYNIGAGITVKISTKLEKEDGHQYELSGVFDDQNKFNLIDATLTEA
jgi:hypothetical protein